jgi:hypothetical protein
VHDGLIKVVAIRQVRSMMLGISPHYYSLAFIIQVIFIIHAAKIGRFWPWGWVIMFLSIIGAVAYVAIELMPEWLGSSRGRRTQATFGSKINFGRRLRLLQLNLEIADTIANRAEFAQELLVRGENEKALAQFQHILAMPHGKSPVFFIGAARAQIGLNDANAALETLEKFRKEFPNTKNIDADLINAVALDMLSQNDQALQKYDSLVGNYPGVEPRVRRAALLLRMGRTEESRAAAEEVVQRVKRSPKYVRHAQAQWFAEAKKLLKS